MTKFMFALHELTVAALIGTTVHVFVPPSPHIVCAVKNPREAPQRFSSGRLHVTAADVGVG